MEIIKAPIDKIEPWSKNPKIVKKADYERLKAQIKLLTNYKPLIVYKDGQKYVVLGGNARLRALRELGHKEIEISIVKPKNEGQKLEYALSDNDRVGEYDDQALAEMLYKDKDQIKVEIFKIDVARPVPIENILTQFGPSIDATLEDKVPDPEAEAKTKLGDIFDIGKHRLVCGDAIKPWPYEALLEGKKVDLVFTDPPYNVAYEGQKYAPIMNDDLTEEGFIRFVEAFMERISDATKKGGVFYICSGYSSYPAFVWGIKKAGMVFSSPIIWVKNTTSMGWEDYKKKHEMLLKGKRPANKAQPILYGWNGGRHYFLEARMEADVWEMSRRASTTMLHPTQKPLGLIQRAIKNSSRPGETVLDIFAGSGSTGIAAEREGRISRMIELDPVYCDVIIRRFEAMGGPTETQIRATRRQAKRPKETAPRPRPRKKAAS